MDIRQLTLTRILPVPVPCLLPKRTKGQNPNIIPPILPKVRTRSIEMGRSCVKRLLIFLIPCMKIFPNFCAIIPQTTNDNDLQTIVKRYTFITKRIAMILKDPDEKRRFFDELPDTFTTEDIHKLAEKYSFSPKTAMRYIYQLINLKINKLSHGKYEKL